MVALSLSNNDSTSDCVINSYTLMCRAEIWAFMHQVPNTRMLLTFAITGNTQMPTNKKEGQINIGTCTYKSQVLKKYLYETNIYFVPNTNFSLIYSLEG